MEPQKYHINNNNEVKPCRATHRKCRFGASDHSTNPADLERIANQRCEAQGMAESGMVLSKKTTSPHITAIRSAVESLNPQSTLEEVSTVGNMVNNEVTRRLSFDPNSIDHNDYTAKQLRELQDTNRKVIAEVTSCGAGIGRTLVGVPARIKEVERNVAFLPDGAKNLVLQKTMMIKNATAKDNCYGQYSMFTRARYQSSPIEEISERNIGNAGVPLNNGDVYTRESVYSDTIEDGKLKSGNGFAAYQKIDDNTVRAVWVGKPLKKSQKVGTGVVIKSRYNKEIKLPHQEIYNNASTIIGEVQEIMLLPKSGSTDFMDSIATHEYSHAVQHGSMMNETTQKLSQHESTPYRKLTAGSTQDTVGEQFPDSYMGAASQRELFTVATEGFFHTAATTQGRNSVTTTHANFLYGANRHKNADTIKNWVAGQWLALDKEGQAFARMRT